MGVGWGTWHKTSETDDQLLVTVALMIVINATLGTNVGTQAVKHSLNSYKWDPSIWEHGGATYIEQLVYKDHHRDQQNMALIHRCSLYASSTISPTIIPIRHSICHVYAIPSIYLPKKVRISAIKEINYNWYRNLFGRVYILQYACAICGVSLAIIINIPSSHRPFDGRLLVCWNATNWLIADLSTYIYHVNFHFIDVEPTLWNAAIWSFAGDVSWAKHGIKFVWFWCLTFQVLQNQIHSWTCLI